MNSMNACDVPYAVQRLERSIILILFCSSTPLASTDKHRDLNEKRRD